MEKIEGGILNGKNTGGNFEWDKGLGGILKEKITGANFEWKKLRKY